MSFLLFGMEGGADSPVEAGMEFLVSLNEVRGQTMKITQKPLGSRFGLEEVQAVIRVMLSGEVSGLTKEGEGDAFVREFAEYCGAKYAMP